MPQTELKPISYNGVTLNDATRSVFFLKGHGVHDNTPPSIVSVERIGVFPSYVRTQPGPGKIYVLALFPITDPAAVIDALRPTFDPSIQVPPVLIVEDENGVQKLCPMVPQGMHFQAGGWWEIPLWAPEPDFVSLTTNNSTVTALADVTKPFTPTVSNDGDGNAFPHSITIKPQAKKTAWGGWQKMWELTFAWRSEFPATSPGSGSWLLDVTDGGINTAAIVDIPAITTTCTTTITAAQAMSRGTPFSLVVGSTSGWDAKGILLTTDTEEQFEYEIIDATHIDVSARALGGTTAVLHTAGPDFTIHQSRMLKDGRDIAVLINNVQVVPEKVNLIGMDTSSTKIWVEFSQGPGSQALIEDAGDGTSGETDFILDRADHGWKVGDYLVKDGAAADEQVRIAAIDGINITVVRGVRNSPASSVVKNEVFWKVDTHVQVAYNSSVALEERPTNPDPPLINLSLSTNLQWEWTTAPIWSAASRSAGAWIRSLYSGPAAIASRLSAMIGLDVTGSSIRFTDIEPTAGKPNFDCVEFQSACGIDDSAGAIEYDASIPWNLALEVIGRDLIGLDHLIQRRHGHETGSLHGVPTVYTDRAETPTEVLSSVLLRAHNLVVTAVETNDVQDEPTGGTAIDATGADFQVFTLTEVTSLHDIVIRTKRTGSSNKTMAILIFANESGEPDPGVEQVLVSPSGWALVAAGIGTSYGQVCFFHSEDIILPAGTYGLQYRYSVGSTGVIDWSQSGEPIYALGTHWEMGPAAIIAQNPGADMWFAFLSADVDNQAEVKGGTGEVLTIDDIKVKFHTSRVPMIAKQADEDAYYMDTSLKRSTENEMRLRFLDRWTDMDTFSVSINNVLRTVTASRYADEIRSILTVKTDDWMIIPPGSNSVDAVPNLEAEDEDLTFTFRDLWQA